MDSQVWIMIFGYAAALFMVLGYLPQAIYTIRTRDTDGIAMPTFLSMFLGSVFFITRVRDNESPNGCSEKRHRLSGDPVGSPDFLPSCLPPEDELPA